MNNLRDELIQAHRDSRFLDTVCEVSIRLSEQKKDLTDVLVDLHNTSTIDVVTAFSTLRNAPENPNFFLTCRVLETVLPELNADVSSVVKCVIHLTKEAGQDWAAGMLIDPYIEFCIKSPLRAYEAIELIQKDTPNLVDLLSPTLIAGARHNVTLYTQKATEFSQHSNLEMRKQAVSSLGRIQYQTKKILVNMATACLAKVATLENDDHLLANALRSAFGIYVRHTSTTHKVASIFDAASKKGGDMTLYAASVVFFSHTCDLPLSLTNMLLKYLTRVKPEHKDILNHIDLGVMKLLETEHQDAATAFLEQLLTNSDIEIEAFDSVARLLLQNENALLNRLMIRWFLGGEQALCHAIDQIIKLSHDKKLILAVAPEELTNTDSIRLIFLARKAIGYLFSNPVTATSILLSLLTFAEDEQTRAAITQLIFDPLLLNYPGQLMHYLKEQEDTDNASIKAASQQAIQEYEKYIEDMRNAGKIQEHRPPVVNREAFRAYYSRKVHQYRREAEKHAVFTQFAKKSVLLYGTKSINYIGEPFAQNKRMELSLQRHSFSIEIPRMHNIDPVGLDYMLRIFRHEKIRA